MCLPLEIDVIVYFTTVNRLASINAGGEIVSVDWERKKILGARPITPIRFSGIDDNPRGGTRGGRGIHFGDGCVHAASYNSVVTFDRELNELQTRGHLAFANLHETCQRGGGIVGFRPLHWTLPYVWILTST